MAFGKINSVIWVPQTVLANTYLVSAPISVPAALSVTFLLYFVNLVANSFGNVGPLFVIYASDSDTDDSGWIPFCRVALPRNSAAIDTNSSAVAADATSIATTTINTGNLDNNNWIFIKDVDLAAWEWMRIRNVVTNTSYNFYDGIHFAHLANTPIHYAAHVVQVTTGVEQFKRLRLAFMSTHCSTPRDAAVAAKLCTQVIV
jgi:hypothetical protein